MCGRLGLDCWFDDDQKAETLLLESVREVLVERQEQVDEPWLVRVRSNWGWLSKIALSWVVGAPFGAMLTFIAFAELNQLSLTLLTIALFSGFVSAAIWLASLSFRPSVYVPENEWDGDLLILVTEYRLADEKRDGGRLLLLWVLTVLTGPVAVTALMMIAIWVQAL